MHSSAVMEFPIEKYLCHFYVLLTATKLVQLFLAWISIKMSKAKRGDSTVLENMEYSPSLQVIISFIDLLMDAPTAKIPRKEYREVTDKWLVDYTKSLQTRGVKRFYSLEAAKRSFYKEFSQDSGTFLISELTGLGAAYLRHPLGLVTVLELFLYICLVVAFTFRELLIGGSLRTLPCKLALAATITDVYVMACADGASFEDTLQKYPWMAGLFSKQQLHPMIGRAVCPVYKRKVIFPKDQMAFKAKFVATPSGMGIVESIHETTWDSMWAHLNAVNGIVLVLVVMIGFRFTHHFDDAQSLLLSGAIFYGVRWFVDNALGIRWLERYTMLP